MSLNGPLSGIRFSGISSGIDVESIVTRLVQLESVGVQRLQRQQLQVQNRQGIYSEFRSRLISFNSALSSLNASSTYAPVKVTSSDTTVATASSESNATTGVYAVQVNRLATAHKISSAAQASTTDPLGVTGQFLVNGKAVTVESSDTLTQVASKINALGVGVTASLLNGGSGNTFLVMTANQSGAASSMRVSDISGGALSALGLLSGGTSLRESPSANVALGQRFNSATDTLQSLTGASKTGTFSIAGTAVNIDFATDSLQGVADKINAAAAGVSASVRTVTENGSTRYQLRLEGAPVTGGLTDPDNILQNLGVLQRGYATPLVNAQDAEVRIDGLTVTQPTNSITSVIPGVTLNLQKTGTTNLALTRDTDKVKTSIKSLAEAYNNVIDFVRQNSKFDSENFQSGPLFGDQTAAQVEQTLSQLLFNNVGSSELPNLAAAGFSLDNQGKLQINESRLDSVIASNLSGLQRLLTSNGQSANAQLSFVSNSNKTVAGTYAVNITQAATRSSVTGSVVPTGPLATSETLSFGGTLFSSPVSLFLESGLSLNQVADRINGDTRLREQVNARVEGGRLMVESRRFGSATNFSLTSNVAADVNTTGIGTTGMTVVNGVNVAGTINGEAATGNGQFLLGNSANATTSGLQIQYTGTTTGAIGSFTFNRGIASLMGYRLESFTDSVNGLLSAVDKSLTEQIRDFDTRIETLQSQISLREQSLRQKFAAMEQSIARLNSQGSQLSSFLRGQRS